MSPPDAPGGLAPRKRDTVLVTGAGGFIGRAVVSHLLAQGWHVHGLDRGSGAGLAGVRHTAVDLADPAALDRTAAAFHGADAIIHLAAAAHGQAKDPGTRDLNVRATRQLADLARRAGLRRFVHVSTVGVHGGRSGPEPLDERAPLAPHTPYAMSKCDAENAVRDALAGSATDWVIVRPVLVYGAQPPGNLARLIRWIERDWPLPLGCVRNRRSLLARQNLADFLALCLIHPAAAREAFLVADGHDLSTPQLVRLLAQGLARRPHLWCVPPAMLRVGAALIGRQALFEQVCGDLAVDIGKARNRLGWTPPLDPEAALQEAGREHRRRVHR